MDGMVSENALTISNLSFLFSHSHPLFFLMLLGLLRTQTRSKLLLSFVVPFIPLLESVMDVWHGGLSALVEMVDGCYGVA